MKNSAGLQTGGVDLRKLVPSRVPAFVLSAGYC